MDRRRIGMLTLALLTLLAPLGCRRWHRRCDDPSPRADIAPADRDSDPGYIPPRGSTIPAPGVPARPEAGRRDTYSPARPAPRLEYPVEPYTPPPTGFGSPFELPRPVESESKKLFDPALPKGLDVPAPQSPEGVKPKKLLVPERMPDPPADVTDTPDSKPTPKVEGTKPVPDRTVFLDPVAPGGAFSLPGGSPKVEEERDPTRRESKASPKPDTPPVGVSDFQQVAGKAGVANGLKPTFEGYEWLAKGGYKAVVFAHDPAGDPAATRAACEAAGLKFVGIPTGPNTIPAATTAFDAAVAGTKDGPVYVCDDTGLRAGTLWYAHFRKVDLANPDTAKVRAGRLGLGDTVTNPVQKELFDAVQKHLDTK